MNILSTYNTTSGIVAKVIFGGQLLKLPLIFVVDITSVTYSALWLFSIIHFIFFRPSGFGLTVKFVQICIPHDYHGFGFQGCILNLFGEGLQGEYLSSISKTQKVVSSGPFHSFHVIFVPLEYVLTLPYML